MLPRAIASYEIVGRLAMGGMAEILLARVVGPSGFERAVVIKRILPHLAARPEFVNMFLDEGRIAARISHPNVAQVFALQEEEGELFQVMEYLEGESAAGLIRRLRSLASSLDYALAGYIVAQACAGLHAAHELRGPDGQHVELVHRDVTPENIFVGYDGTVRVLDFGIAKAANRLTQTDAGLIKGKFAYMSPEQTLGRPLDRRSDIFSLGIVLYELSTQRSLFRRSNQPATIQAINSDPVLPPSVIHQDYPRPLERVCLKALCGEPRERFNTAREMQGAILEALRSFPSPTVPEQALATLMRGLFPDRIADKQAMLRGLEHGITPNHVPAAEVNISVQIPSVVVDEPAGKRWRALGVIVLAVLGAGTLWLAGQHDNATVAERSVVPDAGPVQPSSEDEGSERVELAIGSRPGGATASIDGRNLGTTPTSVQVPLSDDPSVLVLELAGHEPSTSEVVPDRNRSVTVVLRPSTTRSPRMTMRRRERSRRVDVGAPVRNDMNVDSWERFN